MRHEVSHHNTQECSQGAVTLWRLECSTQTKLHMKLKNYILIFFPNINHLDHSNSNNQEVSTTDKGNDKLQWYYCNGYTRGGN